MSSTDVVAKNQQQTSLVNTATTDDTKVSRAANDLDVEEVDTGREDDDDEEVKPRLCDASFDYCEDVARINEANDNDDQTHTIASSVTAATNAPTVTVRTTTDGVEIKEEPALSVDDPIDECSKSVDSEDVIGSGNNNGSSLLKTESNDDDDDVDETIHRTPTIRPDDAVASSSQAQPASDPKAVETFFNAFEEHVRSREKESQCSYMEAYGFVITFRYVHDEQKERDKDTELAINALLARYTGIESLNVLQVFLESLNANGELDEFKSSNLKPVDCILLTYLQLRVCISFRDLAKVFESTVESVQACFLATVNKIKKALGSVIYWPSREETEMTIPKFFKPAYSNVRTIFTNLVVQTNEVYKQRYVIGFAPSGFVSYISGGYNATTHSDERIFRDEKIRQRFERNQDALMVLDGFPIENLLGINNFRVFRPPFLVKTILPDNKSRVYENTALYKHVLALTTIFDKFAILSCKNLNHFVEEFVFCVCVCNNYNILFRNT